MTTAMDLSAFSGALKTIYSKDKVENLTYANNPFHGMLKKDKNFVGSQMNFALIYGNPTGGGVSIAAAQSASQGSAIQGWQLTRKAHYNVAAVTNETILASASDAGALLRALVTEINGAMRNCIRHLAVMEYGDGTGVIGTVAANTSSTNALALASIPSGTNFEKGQWIAVFSNTSTSPTARGARQITNINRATGDITFGGSTMSLTAGDVIVNGSGTTNSSGVGSDNDLNNVITGLAGWIPLSAPTSTTFFGVDRSVDTERLGGVRTVATTVTIDEGIINGLRDVARSGGSPDVVFMNFENFASLVKLTGTQARYEEKVKVGISYSGILVNGPTGQVKVIPDRNCPGDRCYILQMDTWVLRSLGDAPAILKPDGLELLRDATKDQVEARIGYYAQLACSAPGYNGVVQLS